MTRSLSVTGPIVVAIAAITSWMTLASGAADLMPEVRAVDAQIARGVVEQQEHRDNQELLEERIQSLIPNADRNCLLLKAWSLDATHRARTEAQREIQRALFAVQRSEIGAWLIDIAAGRGVTICLDRATSLEAHYRSHLRLLGLSTRLRPAGQIVFLAHELAHVPQHPRFSNNRRFSPRDMLLLQRAREAAAEAVATRVLWQLRQQGQSAPWQEKLATAYRDIAETFEASMAGDGGSASELRATRSAFHHWFDADWRLEIYDDLMLKTLSRIAGDPIGLIPTSRHLSDRYLRGIADYADQGFLQVGDGQALMEVFRDRVLPANGQTRLDAILAAAGEKAEPTFTPSLASETLSAANPRAAAEGSDETAY